MKCLPKKSYALLTLLITFFVLFSQESPGFAKEVFKGSTGSFVVYDRGTSRFKRLLHSDMYMSVKFDLITANVKNLLEPEGITTIHIAHYNDQEAKRAASTCYRDIYSKYEQAHTAIQGKITETNRKIDSIITGASGTRRSRMSTATNRTALRQWEEIDTAIDELCTFYDEKRDGFIEEIDTILTNRLYTHDAYKKAEEANAKYQIKKTRIKEIGLGCFSMAGSVTRICFGDIGSIVSFIDQAKDLFLWCKQNFNRKADDLFDDYHELDEALNALARSADEGRIQSNLSRVEKAYNSYVKMTGKFDPRAIDKLMDVEQFTSQISDLGAALDNIKQKNRIKEANVSRFAEIKKQLQTLEKSRDSIQNAARMLKEPLVNSDEIRKRKNILVRKKETELKNLQLTRKSSGSGKLRGFGSILSRSLTHIENILSTVTQITDTGL